MPSLSCRASCALAAIALVSGCSQGSSGSSGTAAPAATAPTPAAAASTSPGVAVAAVTRPKPSKGAHVKGIDVSSYQGTIDWARVANTGLGFAIARVSDGFYHDRDFAKNWAGMKANGLIRGAYQFIRASKDGTQQADDFLSLVTFSPGDLPPIADVETLDGMSASHLENVLTAWVDEVTARTGMHPMIYTSPGLWNGWHMPSFAQESLWVANWGVSSPHVPKGWTDWTIWQYSDNVSTPGIPAGGVDGNEFNGTLADLYAFVKAQAPPGSTVPPPPPPPAPPPSTPPPSPTRTMSPGDTGTDVVRLQDALSNAGYDPGPIDGIFGPKTENAVVAYQSAHGLVPDGIVGPFTKASLGLP